MNTASPETAQLRQTMVDCQVRTFDVTDHAVLMQMAAIPREKFLPQDQQALAYSDKPIEISEGAVSRRVLAPMVLARLLQAADVAAGDRVLCVGGATGYGAAVAAGLAGEVFALEEDGAFSATAQAVFESLGLDNAKAMTGALASGLAAKGPFDVIVIEGAVEVRPEALLAQLKDGGRLVTLVSVSGGGHSGACRATCYEKTDGTVGTKPLFSCAAQVLPAFAATSGFAF